LRVDFAHLREDLVRIDHRLDTFNKRLGGSPAVLADPKEVVDALNRALRRAVSDPGVVAKLEQLGSLPFPRRRADARGPQAAVRRRPAAGVEAHREFRRQGQGSAVRRATEARRIGAPRSTAGGGAQRLGQRARMRVRSRTAVS